MANLVKRCFSEIDLEAIKDAVSEAESRTSGEIVVRLASKSKNWVLDRLAVASLIAILAITITLLFTREQNWGVYYNFTQATIWGIIGFALGYFLVALLIDNASKRRSTVWKKARKTFDGLTPTRGNTGVLLFVSVAEKVAVVIADKGIASKLPPDYWNHPQAVMEEAIRKYRHAEGIITAIREIGARLAEHFPAAPDDKNEISDRPEIV